MKIKDGFITKDDDGTTRFHTERPKQYDTFWTSLSYVFIDLDIFEGIELEDKGIKQIYNGKLIDPLPDLKEGEIIEVLMFDKWVKRPFAGFNKDGDVLVYTEHMVAESWRLLERKRA
jgi:hypothetical protein